MGVLNVPIEKPKPNVDVFIKAVTTDYEPDRPRLIEYLFNVPVMKGILEAAGRKWVDPGPDSQDAYWDNFIALWYHMGYDFVRIERAMGFPGIERRHVDDDNRSFAETSRGPVQTWKDFEEYQWPDPSEGAFFEYEYIASHLPDGMGLICNHAGGPYEFMVKLMGYETLCIALFEEPGLVAAVANRIGELMQKYYERLLQLDNLIAMLPGDDMGFRTATLISPDDLRKYILPWHKTFAAMAHEAGVLYFLHSCGNVEAIMEDLIEDVGIDAKHSFEDAIMPVGEFKKKYGERIGVLGGVDVDKLSRLDPDSLRKYVRGIIDDCAPGGRFAIGSGNSVPDYVPVENYLTFVDEVMR